MAKARKAAQTEYLVVLKSPDGEVRRTSLVVADEDEARALVEQQVADIHAAEGEDGPGLYEIESITAQ